MGILRLKVATRTCPTVIAALEGGGTAVRTGDSLNKIGTLQLVGL